MNTYRMFAIDFRRSSPAGTGMRSNQTLSCQANPSMESRLEKVIKFIKPWSTQKPEILAVGLCGSWAKGTKRADSDIDLLFVTTDQVKFRTPQWLSEIKWNGVIREWSDEEYGAAWSRRVFLTDSTEIEFTFANKSWASIDPIDEGTFKVVSDGFEIIYYPNHLLSALVHGYEGIKALRQQGI
jgi:uncharacterized protein